MHSYEQAIFDFIQEHPKCTRAKIITHFHQLSSKTVYRNLQRLKAKRVIVEDKYHEFYVYADEDARRDDWPVHKILKDFMVGTEITSAYANQDDQALEKLIALSQKYNQELGLLVINLTVIMATINNLDVHKGFDQKRPLDRAAFDVEVYQLEQICAALQKGSIKAA